MTKISKVTIDNTFVPPKLHSYELTLKFDLNTYGEPIDPDVATALNRVLDDYCEGRRPFPVEMLVEGLDLCLKNAAYQAIQKRMIQMYGDEMVPSFNGRGETAKWSIETGKAYDELRASSAMPHLASPGKAKIERVE